MVYVILLVYFVVLFVFFFKQKTAYEMRISDWSSDVCSSDLPGPDSGHVLFQILGDEKFFQSANRIALLPALDFFLGAIRRCKEAFFGFDMSPPAIGTSLDERGPFA